MATSRSNTSSGGDPVSPQVRQIFLNNLTQQLTELAGSRRTPEDVARMASQIEQRLFAQSTTQEQYMNAVIQQIASLRASQASAPAVAPRAHPLNAATSTNNSAAVVAAARAQTAQQDSATPSESNRQSALEFLRSCAAVLQQQQAQGGSMPRQTEFVRQLREEVIAVQSLLSKNHSGNQLPAAVATRLRRLMEQFRALNRASQQQQQQKQQHQQHVATAALAVASP